MKLTIFLLFLSLYSSYVLAQLDNTADRNAPARQILRDKSIMPPSPDETCPHCTPAEQLVVDLIYYKQILDLVEQINQQRNKINAGLLHSVHAELIKTRPHLATLLKTNIETRKVSAPPVRKPAKKKARPAQKPPPRQGIEGLAVGHVNEENKQLGIKSSVVLISNGRPRSMTVGSTIEHNRRTYKILKVIYVEDRNKGNRHEVHLQEQNSKKTHIVPWK